jgi:hypothetical protein
VEKSVLGIVKGQVRDLASSHGIADRRTRPVAPRPEPIAEQLPLFAFASGA